MAIYIYPSLIFIVMSIAVNHFLNLEFSKSKNIFTKRRVKNIRKLSREQLLERQLARSLNSEDKEKKDLFTYLDDKLFFVRSPLTSHEFIILSLILGLCGFVFGYFVFQFWYMSIVCFVLIAIIPFIMLNRIDTKLVIKGNKVTKHFISTIRESSIGANNPLDAIKKSISTTKEPLKTLVKDAVTLSENGTIPIEDSFYKMAITMKNDYLLLLAISLKKQKETGHDFRKLISNTYTIVNNDEEIENNNYLETKYGTLTFTILFIIYIATFLAIRLVFPSIYFLMLNNSFGKLVLYISPLFVLANFLMTIWIYRK